MSTLFEDLQEGLLQAIDYAKGQGPARVAASTGTEKGKHVMKELYPIDGKTDKELIDEYSIEADDRTFVPARLLDVIGERQARVTDKQPGDLGTVDTKHHTIILRDLHGANIPLVLHDVIHSNPSSSMRNGRRLICEKAKMLCFKDIQSGITRKR